MFKKIVLSIVLVVCCVAHTGSVSTESKESLEKALNNPKALGKAIKAILDNDKAFSNKKGVINPAVKNTLKTLSENDRTIEQVASFCQIKAAQSSHTQDEVDDLGKIAKAMINNELLPGTKKPCITSPNKTVETHGQYASIELASQDADIIYAQSVLIHDAEPIDQSLFSPKENIYRVLLGLIKSEHDCIDCAMFNMTDKGIEHELINAKKRGVIVTIIADGAQAKNDKNSVIEKLSFAGISVYLFPKQDSEEVTKKRLPMMHDKFIIFSNVFNGKKMVETGLYNFTYAARNNQENVIFRENSKMYDTFKTQFLEIEKLCDLPEKKEEAEPWSV
jgi:hypothetical protein